MATMKVCHPDPAEEPDRQGAFCHPWQWEAQNNPLPDIGGLIPEGWRSSQFSLSGVRDAHQFISHHYDPFVRLNRQAAIVSINFRNSQDREN
jgi:hypothetical protein